MTVTSGTQDLCGNSTWTISLPQNIHTGAGATFAGLTLNSSAVAVASLATGDVLAGDGSGTLQYDASARVLYLWRATADATSPAIVAYKSRGTTSAPEIVTSGDDILMIRGYTHHGSGFAESARITFDTEGTVTSGSTVGGVIRFLTAPASGSVAERMTITSSGNVGIGTTSPSYRLHVSGDAGITGSLYLSGGTRYIGTSNSNNLILRTANTDRLVITSSGDVGIGTTSPSSRLHVTGSILVESGSIALKHTSHQYNVIQAYASDANGLALVI